MKIRIAYNQPEIFGYIHIDPKPVNTEIPAYTAGLNALNLDNIAENNECTDIIAGELLNFIEIGKLYSTLSHLAMKLRHGGKLCIGGIDCRLLALSIINGSLNPKEYNDIIYGENRLGMFPSEDVVSILLNCGLDIVTREVNSINYLIVCERK